MGEPVGAEPPSDAPPAETAAAPEKLTSRKLRNPVLALGLAVELLRSRAPFTRFRFGKFASVIKGQIRRGHYLFTFRGAQPVGYMGLGGMLGEHRAGLDGGGLQPHLQGMHERRHLRPDHVRLPDQVGDLPPDPAEPVADPDRPIYFMREYKDGRSRKLTVRNKIFKRP